MNEKNLGEREKRKDKNFLFSAENKGFWFPPNLGPQLNHVKSCFTCFSSDCVCINHISPRSQVFIRWWILPSVDLTQSNIEALSHQNMDWEIIQTMKSLSMTVVGEKEHSSTAPLGEMHCCFYAADSPFNFFSLATQQKGCGPVQCVDCGFLRIFHLKNSWNAARLGKPGMRIHA